MKARFEGSGLRLYEAAPLQSDIPAFAALAAAPGLFERVQVDGGGYAVVWNDELDLASEEIWFKGRPLAPDG